MKASMVDSGNGKIAANDGVALDVWRESATDIAGNLLARDAPLRHQGS
jgi:hypothetical protein